MLKHCINHELKVKASRHHFLLPKNKLFHPETPHFQPCSVISKNSILGIKQDFQSLAI